MHSIAVLRLFAAAVIFNIVTATTVSAVALQPSRFFEHIESSFGTVAGDETSPESIPLVATIEGFGNLTAAAVTQGGVLPRAEVQVTLNIQPQSFSSKYVSADASLRYYWAIEQIGGPAWGESVPVDIATRGFASYTIDSINGPGMQNMYATAFFQTAGDGNRTFTASPCSVDCKIPGTFSFNEAFTADVTPNVANRVQLDTLVWGALWDGSIIASAWVDPSITISPGFDRRDDFQIVFSSHVAAVPVPASALLLLSACPLALWRRRRTAAGACKTRGHHT